LQNIPEIVLCTTCSHSLTVDEWTGQAVIEVYTFCQVRFQSSALEVWAVDRTLMRKSAPEHL